MKVRFVFFVAAVSLTIFAIAGYVFAKGAPHGGGAKSFSGRSGGAARSMSKGGSSFRGPSHSAARVPSHAFRGPSGSRSVPHASVPRSPSHSMPRSGAPHTAMHSMHHGSPARSPSVHAPGLNHGSPSRSPSVHAPGLNHGSPSRSPSVHAPGLNHGSPARSPSVHAPGLNHGSPARSPSVHAPGLNHGSPARSPSPHTGMHSMNHKGPTFGTGPRSPEGKPPGGGSSSHHATHARPPGGHSPGCEPKSPVRPHPPVAHDRSTRPQIKGHSPECSPPGREHHKPAGHHPVCDKHPGHHQPAGREHVRHHHDTHCDYRGQTRVTEINRSFRSYYNREVYYGRSYGSGFSLALLGFALGGYGSSGCYGGYGGYGGYYGSCCDWQGMNSYMGNCWQQPAYYGWGDNVSIKDEQVYYGSDRVCSAKEFYDMAVEIAARNTLTEPPSMCKAVGAYACVKEGGDPHEHIFELSVDKDGRVFGNYRRASESQVFPVIGFMDKARQLVAFRLAGDDNLVYVAGFANLEHPEVPLLALNGPSESESWMLVRLKEQPQPQN